MDSPTRSHSLKLSEKTQVDQQVTSVHEGFDFEKVLRDMVDSRKQAGIIPRELGVTFKDLHVVGLGAAASHQDTIASTLNPVNLIKVIQNQRHPATRDILSGFEGVVRPGEMLLVLGRPGSGCSTFLKILSNKRDEYHAVNGDVHYDSFSPETIAKSYRGDIQYCPEDDIHFPTLTVSQTIEFAARVRAPKQRLGLSRSEYAKTTADTLMTLFGLQHTKNTPIGDAILRGVSGGEKKRVSICEALAARTCLTSWDNATRGLDSSTALEYVQALRTATDVSRLTTIVSLYQAGEHLYELFDKVCVIYEGRMAYFGPANQARDYFINLGYEPAHRQTTADFLVAVTDPNARIPRQIEAPLPRTAAEFAASFALSAAGERNRDDMNSYLAECLADEKGVVNYKQSVVAEHARYARRTSPYVASLFTQASAVMVRRFHIVLGARLVTMINIIGYIFQGIIMGTLFLKAPQESSAFYSRAGVLFFALFLSALMSTTEIPALFSQRPIILRHQQWGLYHPFIEAVALTLVDVPVTFFTSLVFGGLVYSLVGLQKSAEQFFIYLLFVFFTAVLMRAYFRSLAAMCQSEATAQTLAGMSILSMALYTGYVLPDASMIWVLRWLTYINPLKYGFEGVMSNEFRTLNGLCTALVPQGPSYANITLANQVCGTVGAIPGQLSVQGSRFIKLSFNYTYSHLWRNFGILVAFGMLFFGLLFLFTEINTSLTGISVMTLYKRGTKLDDAADSNDAGYTEKQPVHETGSSNGRKDKGTKHKDVFSFTHLRYHINLPNGDTKQLLDNVSGYVFPGSLTALMGESGAGKTTLLNVLAERTDVGVVTGDRFINGQALPDDFQSQTGYCQQLDTHLPTASVREALLFSAKLRQPVTVPLAEKEEYVDKCLHMCGLWNERNAIVGSLGVELRKRTTIGVELAAKPKILLFLDEPTSGLDSQSAWNIVAFLRSLADQGQAILCTIHQPSAELFHVFDRVLLLRKGGQTVYFGDLGHNAETLLHYFDSNGARPCLPEENPAEYMLDVIGAGATAFSSINWHEVWKRSPEAVRTEQEIEEIHTIGRSQPAVETALRTEYPTPWRNQVIELVKRGAADHYRNSEYLFAKLILNVAGGFFIGLSFFKNQDSMQGVQNRIFAVYMLLVLSQPLANMLQVPFVATRTIYEVRERPSRMYSWTALITAQILAELPWNILGSSLYFLVWYWTSRFPSGRAGYSYLSVGVVFPLYYTTIAQAIASMAPSAEIAQLLFGFLFSFIIIFNGVMQPYRELNWWKWMYRVSPYTYLLEGFAGQALGHRPVSCSPIEFVTVEPPNNLTCGQYMADFISTAGGYLQNPDATSGCQFCGVNNTDQYLASYFNIFYDHRWRNIGFMIVFSMFNVFAIYTLTYLFRIHTGSFLPSRKRKSS
ncbi:Brefeldin A resistance protein [Psilocybe cubensis]|uniref:Brefeldin A resistance protein n=1 Tax=Psilocybe cubensis TaxID=181762 RepID=A0ACB8GY99_PSICU|nr:Brefeldin A resistance protein [Psilocybe cubensis]KAH9480206.1 Brefeldin A resistance protein [Psilocybe cubensis]